ncbi:hypothetical protein [Flavobacterium sp.]|uniref:hypothetical protein n=1 Tax=Flavobacterium sp. TaxID=239 RepID=UPI0031DE0D0B
MTKLLGLLSAILLLNSNEKKEIVAVYSAISCPCAQWKVKDEKENIYLERDNEKLPEADRLWDGKTLPFQVAVRGKFKKEKGIPKGYGTKGQPEPAKIFVYSEIRVLKE